VITNHMAANGLVELIEAHDDLDRRLQSGDPRMFLSDWNGAHRFAHDYLGPLATKPFAEWGTLTGYSKMQLDEELKQKIVDFHWKRGETVHRTENVYPSAGSAGFLATFALWLNENHPDGPIHFLPPLYHFVARWMCRLGRDVRPVAARQAFDADLVLDLPKRRTVLLMTAPLWYAGRHIPAEVVAQIRTWQEATGSLVFVDGTFLYEAWDPQHSEPTATLVPELTMRLVCPTKALGMHSSRFAYLLMPEGLIDGFGALHALLHGPASLADRVFAHQAMDVLISDENNRSLLADVQDSYRRLIEAGAVLDHFEPETGYFLFGRPAADAAAYIGMDEHCFGPIGRPGYVRINLCKPEALEFLLGAAAASA
jgi:histidinol-phosphate/aromatic aminotransferase/cobyric acid decarboxylase-like protein